MPTIGRTRSNQPSPAALSAGFAGGEQAEALRRQRRHQHRCRTHAEGFPRGRADAEPDRAHPVGDARALAQESQDAAEIGGERLGDVKESEIGARRQTRELVGASLGHRGPAVALGMRGKKAEIGTGHPSLPFSPSTRAT
jgi:hypothetical protein